MKIQGLSCPCKKQIEGWKAPVLFQVMGTAEDTNILCPALDTVVIYLAQ